MICNCPEVLGYLFVAVQVVVYGALAVMFWRAGK